MTNTIFLVLGLALLIASPVNAQPRKSQVGEIDIAEEAKVNPYESVQGSVNQFAEQLLGAAKAGKSVTIRTLSESELTFLNSAYLFCAVNQGTCPELLDLVYEADLINSVHSGKATCPQMTTFWKLWLKSDMEQRHKYLVRTGFLSASDEFRRVRRPQYIKCQENLPALISQGGKELLAARYAPNSATLNSLERASRILAEIKAKIPDIYREVGSRN